MVNRQTTSDKRILEAYDRCAGMIDTGATISDCRKLCPELKRLEKDEMQQVMDLLETTLMFKKAYREPEEASPAEQYVEAGRERFLAAMKNNNQPVKTHKLFPFRIAGFARSAYVAATVAAVALIMLTGGLVRYSADSLPGSALYSVKRMTENAQLALTFNKESKARLHYELAQKRIAEVTQLMESGDSGNAESAYTEAKESLDEADKIAGTGIKDNSKKELKENIDSLNETIKEQSKKLAVNLERGDEKTGAESETGGKAVNSSKLNSLKNTGGALDGDRVADADAATETEDNSINSISGEKTGENGLMEIIEGKNNDTLGKENVAIDAENESSKSNRKKGYSSKENTKTEKEPADVAPPIEKATASMIPFEVGSVKVSDGSFSPNGDGVKDMIEVSVNGATSEEFSVSVFQGSTKIVTILEQSLGKDAKVSWNGSGEDGFKLPDGEYTLRVADSAGQVAHNKAKVVIDIKAPRIKVVGPPSGVITENQTPQFVWKDDENISSYYFHIAPGSTSAGGSKTITNITNNFYEPSEKLPPGLWTWCVIAKDEAGNVGVSPYAELTIELPGQNDS